MDLRTVFLLAPCCFDAARVQVCPPKPIATCSVADKRNLLCFPGWHLAKMPVKISPISFGLRSPLHLVRKLFTSAEIFPMRRLLFAAKCSKQPATTSCVKALLRFSAWLLFAALARLHFSSVVHGSVLFVVVLRLRPSSCRESSVHFRFGLAGSGTSCKSTRSPPAKAACSKSGSVTSSQDSGSPPPAAEGSSSPV